MEFAVVRASPDPVLRTLVVVAGTVSGVVLKTREGAASVPATVMPSSTPEDRRGRCAGRAAAGERHEGEDGEDRRAQTRPGHGGPSGGCAALGGREGGGRRARGQRYLVSRRAPGRDVRRLARRSGGGRTASPSSGRPPPPTPPCSALCPRFWSPWRPETRTQALTGVDRGWKGWRRVEGRRTGRIVHWVSLLRGDVAGSDGVRCRSDPHRLHGQHLSLPLHRAAAEPAPCAGAALGHRAHRRPQRGDAGPGRLEHGGAGGGRAREPRRRPRALPGPPAQPRPRRVGRPSSSRRRASTAVPSAGWCRRPAVGSSPCGTSPSSWPGHARAGMPAARRRTSVTGSSWSPRPPPPSAGWSHRSAGLRPISSTPSAERTRWWPR